MVKAKSPPSPKAAEPPSGVRGVTISGDAFGAAIAGSTIMVQSVIAHSYNSISNSMGSNVADAMTVVIAILAKKNDNEARDLLEALLEELGRGKPRKPLLRVIWDGILKISPELTEAGPQLRELEQAFKNDTSD